MAKSIRKRGQKFIKRFSRASLRASEGSKEHIKENLLERFSHIRNIRLLIFEWSLLALGLIMLAVTQAFWFGDSYSETVFVDGGSYTEATIGRVNSLNPLFATTSSEKVLSRLMFATLVEVDYSGNPGLGLIKSLVSEEDGKIWKIHLRDNLKWSDGEPITNSDVMFTVDLIQNPAVNSVYSSYLENVSVAENANGEIVFTLPAAYAGFASALEFPVLPKHELSDAAVKTLIEDDFSNAPVTSGAFAFNALQTATTSDEEIVYLSANPYYYGGKPALSAFAVHTYTDKTGVVDALNAGAVTATAEISGGDADAVANGSFEKRETSIDVGAFAFLNTSGTLRSTELRRAIRQGINVAELRAVATGTAELNYPLIQSQINLSSYPEIPGYNFAAAEAKIHELAGDNPLHLNIATVSSGYLPAVAEALKGQLAALGIEAELMVYPETQEFVANIVSRRSYDILLYEVELGADPDPLPYYHSSQATAAGLNLANYRNSLVDDLLIGARETTDKDLRARKYESFLEYWVEDVPAIGLYQANMTYIYNKNVHTYGENVHLVTALDRFVDVDDWGVNKGTKDKTP
ncbi:hypothetical protein IKE79_00225 [Candidatus Saccharibacteria bacterium]|nr:hypothetical protein [Candidatus Saccharibacteria bacterium]